MAVNEAIFDEERWQYIEPQRGIPTRIWRGLLTFAKRKPLGAFGGVLILTPVLACVFGPGFTINPFFWTFGLINVPVTFPQLTPFDYDEYTLGQDVLVPPNGTHPFGTDHLGRDLFSRLLYGGRLSFAIGWSVFAISSVMSLSLTIICAYYIRTVDLIMQRVIEIVGFLPDLILIITLFSIYGANPITLILTLGILRGFDTGRVLRSVIIGVKALPFIEAAKTLGATDMRVIRRHIIPQIAYLIIVNATGALASVLLVESGLAILGFGLDPNYPTLGNLLNNSRQYLRVAPHLAIFPGLFIFMLLLGARLLGDALRDVLDPRLRGSR
jgi:peptide/nickel transport system permease protein